VTAGCGGGIPLVKNCKPSIGGFDTRAFFLSPLGADGNAGRAAVTSPRMNNVDVGLLKDTCLTERSELEFRAEASTCSTRRFSVYPR
jgi:hypothetical protein